MKVLLLKTSSLGDVVHALPAVTDAARAIPGIRFDWVVEESFSAIPGWHPAVSRVIPIALRRWRRGWRKAWTSGQISSFLIDLRREHYDLVLDAQGLFLKSALPGLAVRGPRAGFDRRSVRDPWAALTYQRQYPVSKGLHAVERNRRLFAQALGYEFNSDHLGYGINMALPSRGECRGEGGLRSYLVFLHATTWPNKHWPEPYWAALAELAGGAGYPVLWPWYTPDERLRAERLIAIAGGELAPRLDLNGMARLLAGAAGVVGVDSGLAHLAAALECPAVTLYGPTSTNLTGAIGQRQCNLAVNQPCAPCLSRKCKLSPLSGSGTNKLFGPEIKPLCFSSVPPEKVWEALSTQMGLNAGS
ncbi:MAG: lipopolysaccharide heptosyltransferase I [Gammaproteobacteria bacterium RIFOXYA12_FULL_61_12]|nr:MAG: lipopolysaccharide heptosyltransferase I [Gammaproteobacteria bacterium RIFOXYA12_FULL_61_12]OGT91737.1 MAG: lipopolysaccharide heptosyltransferase I [Gammaproteobacteria bacterium RIFOXYD12_FULL_61_37]